MVRRAEEQDAVALARIYNQAMKPGIFATCDIAPVSAENRIEWLSHHQEPFPAWVYELNGKVVGWSSLSPFSVRPCYLSVAEVSVYVDEQHRSQRIGAELFINLVDEARKRGFRTLLSLGFEKNLTSNVGCAIYGFLPNAVLYEVASMAGKWENVLWLEKDLRISDPRRYRSFLINHIPTAAAGINDPVHP